MTVSENCQNPQWEICTRGKMRNTSGAARLSWKGTEAVVTPCLSCVTSFWTQAETLKLPLLEKLMLSLFLVWFHWECSESLWTALCWAYINILCVLQSTELTTFSSNKQISELLLKQKLLVLSHIFWTEWAWLRLRDINWSKCSG